jgi:hypothetical protein
MQIHRLKMATKARLMLLGFVSPLIVAVFSSVVGAGPVFAANPTATWTSATTIIYNGILYTAVSNASPMVLNGPLTCFANDFITVTNPTDPKTQSAIATTFTFKSGSRGPTVCGKTTQPLTLTNSSTNPDPSAGIIGATDNCPINDDSQLRWVLCPLFLLADKTLNALNSLIQSLMYTPVDQIFGKSIPIQTSTCTPSGANGTQKCTTNPGTASFEATFNAFRNLGIGLMVIAGIIMVGAQAAGLEVFSAYTVRKALPRIVAALLGMVLAWPVLQIVVTFFNDLGMWASSLILVTSHVQTGTAYDPANVGFGLFAYFFGVGGVLVIAMGFGVLGFLGTALLALLVGFIVIAVVKLGILLLILTFPLAIACSVLPGTQKIWNISREWLIGLLVAFPAIEAFLATGKAASSIAAAAGTAANNSGDAGGSITWNLLAFVVLIAPYFLLALVPQLIGGAFSAIHGLVNDRHKGGFAAMRDFRGREMKYLDEERMAGRRGLIGKSFGGGTYQQFRQRGGVFGNRAVYNAKQAHRHNQLAAKAVQEAPEISGNDDAIKLGAKFGGRGAYARMPRMMARSQFLNEYQRNTGSTRLEAQEALGAMEANFGELGSQSMQRAVVRAKIQSNTVYGAGAGGTADMINDANEAVRSGLYTDSQMVGMMKQESKRLDVNKIPWNDLFPMVSDAGRRAGPYNAGSTQIRGALGHVLDNMNPNELIGTHDNSIMTLAPLMHERMQDAGAALQANPTDVGLQRAYYQRVADTSQVLDVLSNMSSKKGNAIADQFYGGPATGATSGNVWNPNAIIGTGRGGAPIRGGAMTSTQRALEDNRNNAVVMERTRQWERPGPTGP